MTVFFASWKGKEKMLHQLKIQKEYYEAIYSEKKKFEIRRDDRPYEVGDYLWLKMYEEDHFYNEEMLCKVEYIYRGELCKEGYCIMSIRKIDAWGFLCNDNNWKNTVAEAVIKDLENEKSKVFKYEKIDI